jgi:hypothetical protein
MNLSPAIVTIDNERADDPHMLPNFGCFHRRNESRACCGSFLSACRMIANCLDYQTAVGMRGIDQI